MTKLKLASQASIVALAMVSRLRRRGEQYASACTVAHAYFNTQAAPSRREQ